MAIEKSFENEQGIEFPKSYWRITSININMHAKQCDYQFTAWIHKAARDAGKQSISSRGFNIQGKEFETYYKKHLALEQNLMEICYEFAKSQKNILAGYIQKEITREVKEVTVIPSNVEGETVEKIVTHTITEQVDDTAKPIFVSFFNNASDV